MPPWLEHLDLLKYCSLMRLCDGEGIVPPSTKVIKTEQTHVTAEEQNKHGGTSKDYGSMI